MPKISTNGEKVCNISNDLHHLIVPINSIKLDPLNARAHPNRNLESIKHSLTLYSQVKPLVVRKSTRVIVAGNGTWEAARSLGWTHIAAVLQDLSAVEAAGYGLADNRTAELAKWKFEAVSEIERLLQENDHPVIGWTDKEIAAVRMVDFTPPEETNADDGDKRVRFSITMEPDSREVVLAAIKVVKDYHRGEDLEDADCLELICTQYLEQVNG